MVWTDVVYKPLTQSENDLFYALDSDNYPPYLQELVSRRRAKVGRWILFGLCALLIVLIIVAVVLYKSRESTPKPEPAKGRNFEISDVLQGKFHARRFNGTWISDWEIYYEDASSAQPFIFNARNLTRRPVLKQVAEGDPSVQSILSPDKRFLLEQSQTQLINRYSYLAKYSVIDVETRTRYPISLPGQPDNRFQLADWIKGTSSLVLIHKNDIYIRPKPTDNNAVRLTTTGVEGVVYNGAPDWVYEEEIFSSNQAVWTSEKGNRLAYATFNDSEVNVMSIPFYGRPGSLISQYPLSLDVRYPKPGTRNPKVSVTVVDLKDIYAKPLPTEDVPPPPQLNEKEPVLSLVSWIGEKLLVIWMNRIQNHAIAQICEIPAASPVICNTILELEHKSGWYDLAARPIRPSGRSVDRATNSSFLLLLPQKVGSDSYRHVSRMDPREPSAPYKRTPLTNGTFVVKEILNWDADGGFVYFKSTSPDDPAATLIQRVSDKLETAPHVPECLSCEFKNCTAATAEVSKNGSFLVLSCLGPSPATVYLINAKEKKNLMTWEANEQLKSYVQTVSLPKKQRMKAPLPDGLSAEIQLLIPPGADLSGGTKYPLLVNVYGGPDSNSVSNTFSVDWNAFISANQSIIVAAIDGRGSGNRGEKTTFAVYRKLGVYEIEDQINVTRYLQNRLKFIDPTRTAIWGWSYGGYASAMSLAKDTQGVFKCGISVAPVTDWIYYDSLYTERYLGLPFENDNKAGYEAAQLNSKVENLRKKEFMLIHGTLDDNVHYQQSMMLTRSLEENDIIFRQQTYPDEKHGISRLQYHLYHNLGNFLSGCFAK